MWNKIKKYIYGIMASKLGKFLFEVMNVIALIVAVGFFFAHANIMLGLVMTFCLSGTVLSLIDKYKKK